MYIKTGWMESILTIIQKNSGHRVTRILLEGPPGSSKTSFAYYVGEELKASVFEVNMTSSMRAEDVLWDIAVAPGNQVIYRKSELWEAFIASHNSPVVLVLDEIDKAKERVEELLLRTLEKFSFRDPYGTEISANSGNLVVIATSNQKRNLMEPTLRRFPLRLKLGFPKKEIQQQIVYSCLNGHPMPDRAVQIVCDMAAELKRHDVDKAPAYNELAELLINFNTLLEAGIGIADIRDALEGGLWKNDDFPGLSFNWARALSNALKEGK